MVACLVCRRASWEVLEAVIGQVDEPFKVTLVYASCHQATAALDSLDLINCEPGWIVCVSHAAHQSLLSHQKESH